MLCIYQHALDETERHYEYMSKLANYMYAEVRKICNFLLTFSILHCGFTLNITLALRFLVKASTVSIFFVALSLN